MKNPLLTVRINKVILCKLISRIVWIAVSLLLSINAFGQNKFWKEVDGPYMSNALSLAYAPNGYLFLGTVNGIYRSTNSGVNWVRLAKAPAGIIKTLYFSLDSTLYALSDGVYYSRDNGSNWVVAGLSSYVIRSFTKASDGSLIAGVQEDGIFRSTNNGVTWNNVGLGGTNVYALAATKSGVVYAGTFDGLFKSIDNGKTWARIAPSVFYTPVGPIAIDPGGNIFAVALGVFRSSDGGQQWEKVFDLHSPSFAFDSLGNSYLGAFNGIYKSTDRGRNWTRSDTGVVKTEVTGLVCTKQNYIFASVYKEGVYRSTTNGASWERLNYGLRDIQIASVFLPSDREIIVASSSGVFRSSDRGVSWSQTIQSDYYGPYTALTSSRKGFLVAGGWGQGLFLSSDSGNTWRKVSSRYYYVSSLISNRFGLVCATTWRDGVGTSSDDGKTWKHLGLENTYVTCATVNTNGSIYVATDSRGIFRIEPEGTLYQVSTHFAYIVCLALDSKGNFFAGTYGQGLFRSTDGGKQWTRLQTGISSLYIYSLFISPTDDIYAGTFYDGVYRSADKGEHWELLSNELEGNEIFSVAMSADGILYLGTNTGLYQSSIPFIRSLFRNSFLSQNYPNPFNSETTIRFTILERSFVTVTVHDILGREVRTLISKDMDEGQHSILLNANGMASGVYFCRLHAGSLRDTKKLLIIR